MIEGRVSLRLPESLNEAIRFANDIRIRALKDLVETRNLAKETNFFDEFIDDIDKLLNDIQTTTINKNFALALAIVRKSIDAVKDTSDKDTNDKPYGFYDNDGYDHENFLSPTEYMVAAINVISVSTVHGAILAANRAIKTRYGYEHKDGTNSNAFYHAYWNAMLVYTIGLSKAKSFTDAHEFGKSDNFRDIVPRLHTKMDLINNAIGMEIGSAAINWPNIIDIEINLSVEISRKIIQQNTPMRRLNVKKTELIATNNDMDCHTYFSK